VVEKDSCFCLTVFIVRGNGLISFFTPPTVSVLDSLTPLNAFLQWEKKDPGKVFLRQPLKGTWHDFTYKEVAQRARKIASALRRMIPPGSKVALLSKNCAEWIIADLGIMMSGNVSVPIYPTLSGESIRPLLLHSESRLIFIGKLDYFTKQRDGIPADIQKISFDAYGLQEGHLLSSIFATETETEIVDAAAGGSIATIMYSSGTTGTPKGVMLTHGAFGFVGEKVAEHFGISRADSFFSYLPLSHIAERALMEMVVFVSGSSISFTESLEKFQENLQHEQPTIFGGVPRIYAKFQEGVLRKIPQKKLDVLLSIPLVSGLIRKSIKKKLGLSRARVIVSGAAPTPITLLFWFETLAVEIRETYGMTENTAFSHSNFRKVKIGTVGEAWPEVECKVDEAGEILIRHAGLMLGYYKDPDTTQAVFTPDGFLRTGDKGEIDAGGFLTITGRVKDQFKTDKAKFIAPAQIELKLQANTDIEQVCIVGVGLPQPIGMVVLSAIGMAKSREEVKQSILSTMEIVNQTLESYERVEKIVIMQEVWSIDNGLLTPSLKLKRAELEKKHHLNYAQWYKQPEPVIWQ
jgi:long-chain acyl-CoA synthetase